VVSSEGAGPVIAGLLPQPLSVASNAALASGRVIHRTDFTIALLEL
jgi:hypothetical protein